MKSNKMKYWIYAIRPKTLMVSQAPVFLGLSIVYSQAKEINTLVALLTAFSALCMQVASNLSNDYLDALKGVDTEMRLGPLRVTHSGLISPKKMKNALIFMMVLALLAGIYLMYIGGAFIMALGLISLYFSYGYTGGPYPLSYNGLGEIAALIFFGPVAVIGTIYLQLHRHLELGLILSLGPGLIAAAILGINNLRDVNSDALTKKLTLAVRFGVPFQRKLCLFFIAMAAVPLIFTALLFQYHCLYPIVFLPLAFMRTWLQIAFKPIDEKLNLALVNTAQYLVLYCLLTSSILLFTKGV